MQERKTIPSTASSCCRPILLFLWEEKLPVKGPYLFDIVFLFALTVQFAVTFIYGILLVFGALAYLQSQGSRETGNTKARTAFS